MNKRAHTPTLLLFVTTIVLAVLALFIFASFKDKFKSNSEKESQILDNIVFYENYISQEIKITAKQTLIELGQIKNKDFVGPIAPASESQLKEKFKEFMQKKNLKILELSLFFDKIEKGEFEFKQNSIGYVFEINSVQIQSSYGASTFKRNLNLKIQFDNEGNVLSVKKPLP